MKKYNIAIVGATGLVGKTFLEVLEKRNFPINNLYLYASSRSAGKKVEYMDKVYEVIELKEENISNDIDIALFSAGGETSKKFAPIFSNKGIVVVDNSSAFRMDDNVPLVVPEANPDKAFEHKGIISNPNCSTIQVIPVLKVIDDLLGIKRIVYSTYQSVSGAGINGLNDLSNNLVGEKSQKFPYDIAFNLIPHIDDFVEDGYTKEEVKMIEETRKILDKPELKITATCVRVPVRYGHAVSVNLELEKDFDVENIKKVLSESEGIILADDVKNKIYPMPINSEGEDEVFVGRIRRDNSVENGLNLWIVADNIRKGAATNTVQIAEILIKKI